MTHLLHIESNMQVNPMINTAFVLRLTWDEVSQNWRIVVKPTDGAPERVFMDIESAFLHVAHNFTQSSRCRLL